MHESGVTVFLMSSLFKGTSAVNDCHRETVWEGIGLMGSSTIFFVCGPKVLVEPSSLTELWLDTRVTKMCIRCQTPGCGPQTWLCTHAFERWSPQACTLSNLKEAASLKPVHL